MRALTGLPTRLQLALNGSLQPLCGALSVSRQSARQRRPCLSLKRILSAERRGATPNTRFSRFVTQAGTWQQ